MKPSRIVRLIELIGLLQSGLGHNASQLAQECGVSRRTVFRYLEVLRDAGVPLIYDEQRQSYRLAASFVLPPTSFTPEEALALVVLCSELGTDAGVPFQSAARSAAVKLQGSMPPKLREQLSDLAQGIKIRLDARAQLVNGAATYDQLLGAIAGRRCVRIRYDSLTEWQEIGTKLSPYQLLFSRRSWYVVGRSSLHRSTRTFNIGRIKSLEPLDDTFEIPRGFSLERYLGNAWHLIPEPGPDRHVVVRFNKKVARNVAEVVWHRTQRIENRPDGSIDFHVDVSGLNEISWWIAGYADQAMVLEPPELRDLLLQRSRNLVARYEGRETVES